MAKKWRKSPEWLVELFHEITPKEPLAEPRKMFGYPCCFVKGNMFTGLHQENMILRLGEKEREQFIKDYDSGLFEPMPGRKMREYVTVPEDMFKDKELLGQWVVKSFNYANSLPQKIKKK